MMVYMCLCVCESMTVYVLGYTLVLRTSSWPWGLGVTPSSAPGTICRAWNWTRVGNKQDRTFIPVLFLPPHVCVLDGILIIWSNWSRGGRWCKVSQSGLSRLKPLAWFSLPPANPTLSWQLPTTVDEMLQMRLGPSLLWIYVLIPLFFLLIHSDNLEVITTLWCS